MSGLPYLKFFPTDWQADAGVRMCSYAARGLWFEMLCIMHKAEGYLRMNGRNLTSAQVARLTGGHVDEVEILMVELDEAGVFSRAEDGAIYCRRMVREGSEASRARAYADVHGRAVFPFPDPDPSSSSFGRRDEDGSDDDGKVAVGPWMGPATLPEGDGARLEAVAKVQAFFAKAPAKRERVLAYVGNPQLVPDPVAYAEQCIANAVHSRHKRQKAKPAERAPAAEPWVWVKLGSPAWNAWNQAEPAKAVETKKYPGEWGRWRRTEYPAEAARA